VLTDLSTRKTVDSLLSDAVSGQFLTVLHPGKDYAFNIQKKGYLLYSQNFNLKDFPDMVSISKIFALTPVRKGVVMRLQNIRLGFDSAVLQPSAYPELHRLVRFLQQNPTVNITIAGYTDNVGGKSYNLKLSVDRAQAVYHYLLQKGISARRMQYRGFGKEFPLTSNETPQGRALNRRTEIMIR
jgi:outer membrane protein OmpA-like peptidoglycan-associated protein